MVTVEGNNLNEVRMKAGLGNDRLPYITIELEHEEVRHGYEVLHYEGVPATTRFRIRVSTYTESFSKVVDSTELFVILRERIYSHTGAARKLKAEKAKQARRERLETARKLKQEIEAQKRNLKLLERG